LAFLGLALVSLRDLWQSTRSAPGAPAEPASFVLGQRDLRVA
jgi:hypothetical protein